MPGSTDGASETSCRSSSNASRGFLLMRAIRERAQKLVSSYVVKTPSLDTPARSLSGGNIQKMIMAREMSAAAPVLVVAQPTRGVDIGAAEYIHARLVDARATGNMQLKIGSMPILLVDIDA